MRKCQVGLSLLSVAGRVVVVLALVGCSKTDGSKNQQGPSDASTSALSAAVSISDAAASIPVVPDAAKAPASSASSDAPSWDPESAPVALAIPVEFVKKREHSSPDGAYSETYQAPGSATLNVSKGPFSPARPSLDTICTDLQTPMPMMRITYKKKTRDFCVVSGFIGDQIFYSKVISRGGVWAQFMISFSQDERGEYDPLLSPMERSFSMCRAEMFRRRPRMQRRRRRNGRTRRRSSRKGGARRTRTARRTITAIAADGASATLQFPLRLDAAARCRALRRETREPLKFFDRSVELPHPRWVEWIAHLLVELCHVFKGCIGLCLWVWFHALVIFPVMVLRLLGLVPQFPLPSC